MQKARRQPPPLIPLQRRGRVGLRPLVSLRFQVLFHSSIRSTFHLSLTVLVHYRSLESYLALPDGTGRFRQDFSGPALLRILRVHNHFYLQGFHLLWPFFPKRSVWDCLLNVVLQPRRSTLLWFGLFPFRSPLLGESLVIFSSSSYLDVSVQRVGFLVLLQDDTPSVYQVVPFGDLWITGCMHLPKAYRSLPRPSSPLSAKASTIRPYFALKIIAFSFLTGRLLHQPHSGYSLQIRTLLFFTLLFCFCFSWFYAQPVILQQPLN